MRAGAWLIGGIVALVVALPARAQVQTSVPFGGDSSWTATAGRTVGNGNGVVHLEAGWPGLGVTYLHGLDERTDAGFHVGYNYGFEGTANRVMGLNVAVPLRRVLGKSGTTTFSFRADPGLSVYGNNGAALVGVGGPIGVVAGFRVDPRLTLDAGADLPVLFSFTNPAGVLFGPQVGAGAEYLVDRNVALTLRARVGPEFAVAPRGSGSQLGFTTLVGVAYNTR